MICPRCGATYNTLVCPVCTERRNREAVMRVQPTFLAKAFAGQFDLTLVRKQHHKPHVQLFGDADRGFCGEPLVGGHRAAIAYNLLLVDSICPLCAGVIANLMNTTVDAL
jgi:hypothetical protein